MNRALKRRKAVFSTAAFLLSLFGILTVQVLAVQQARAVPLNEQQIKAKKLRIHECLLKIYRAQNRRKDAIKQFAILAKLKQNDSRFLFEYGKYLAQSGNYGGALVQLRKAERLDPTTAEIQGTLGAVSIKMKDFKAALDHYRKAVALGGDYKKHYDDTAKYVSSIERRKAYEAQQKAYKKKMEARRKAMQAQAEEDDNDW